MIRNALHRLMYGRYGSDRLNLCLVVLYFLFFLLYTFTRLGPLYWVSMVLLVLAFFRMFSRNPVKRREENAAFMKIAGPALCWLRHRRTVHRDKEHRYFRCPSCAQQLRVPRGKGRITVTCRNCGASFQEKS